MLWCMRLALHCNAVYRPATERLTRKNIFTAAIQSETQVVFGLQLLNGEIPPRNRRKQILRNCLRNALISAAICIPAVSRKKLRQ